MMACCEHSEEWYIHQHEDGNVIDEKWIAKNYGEGYTAHTSLVKVENYFLIAGSYMQEQIHLKGDGLEDIKLCTCCCHVHGMNIMH